MLVVIVRAIRSSGSNGSRVIAAMLDVKPSAGFCDGSISFFLSHEISNVRSIRIQRLTSFHPTLHDRCAYVPGD